MSGSARPWGNRLLIAVIGVMSAAIGVAIAANLPIHSASQAADGGGASDPTTDSELVPESAEIAQAVEEAQLDLNETQVNQNGETYGTLSDTTSFEDAPDLIAVWIDSETIGYVPRAYIMPNPEVAAEVELLDSVSTPGAAVDAYDHTGTHVIGQWYPAGEG